MEPLAACRICSFQQFQSRYEKNGFKLVNCLNCGLLQVRNSPSKSELEACYDQNFFDEAYGTLLKNSRRQNSEYKKFIYRWDEIEKKSKNGGKVLDVGCSFGFFLDAGRRRGWDCYGIEISEFAADYAKSRFGLRVQSVPLEDADFEPESFDVVTLWNVIEHLDDPAAAVRQIYRILKPGGLIVLTTGDAESPLARLQGGKWRMLMPPIHLSHFSPATIKYLMESSKLTVVEQTWALPFESLLNKVRLIDVCKHLYLSDKMLVYAKKVAPVQA
jgi:2-polyprenyl-3-methyl-5-hydroxy-6-metoxy-1,4-benzoquinol methylase